MHGSLIFFINEQFTECLLCDKHCAKFEQLNRVAYDLRLYEVSNIALGDVQSTIRL